MAFLEHILSAADMIKSDVEKKRQYQQQLGLTMAKMQAQNQREQQQQDAIAQRQQSHHGGDGQPAAGDQPGQPQHCRGEFESLLRGAHVYL